MSVWRRIPGWVYATVAGVVVVGLIAWGVTAYIVERNREANDLRDDIAVMQLAPAVGNGKHVYWEDETYTTKNAAGQKVTKTESVLEAQVLVRGCKVELVRADDETNVIDTVKNRAIETTIVEEVNLANPDREIEITDWSGLPTPERIDDYLSKNRARFPCYDPRAKLSLATA